MPSSDDVPWLREMADEEVTDLFESSPRSVQRTVQRLLERLNADADLAETLVDTLLESLEHDNDDTDATLWIILILGRAGIRGATTALVQALGHADSEEVQRVATISLLRLGESGIETLLDTLEEEEALPPPELSLAAYRLFGQLGYLDDTQLHRRVIDFLRVRLELDAGLDEALLLQEQAALALAALGDHESLPALRELQEGSGGGQNPALQDAIELLEENQDGAVRGLDRIPGEEDYEWIFAFAPQPTRERLERREGGSEGNGEAGKRDDGDADLGSLYRGLGGDHSRPGGSS